MRIRLVVFFVIVAAALICLTGPPSNSEPLSARCGARATSEGSRAFARLEAYEQNQMDQSQRPRRG